MIKSFLEFLLSGSGKSDAKEGRERGIVGETIPRKVIGTW